MSVHENIHQTQAAVLHGGGHRHLSCAENSGPRVPVIGSRLRHSQRRPVHFAVTNAAKVGRERGASLVAHLEEGTGLLVNCSVGRYQMCA